MRARPERSGVVRVGRWLGPTLLGPAVGAWMFVILHALFTGASLASAAAEIVLGTVMGVVLGAALGLVDFSLLLLRLRRPPTGARGWMSSMAAGGAATLLWRLLRPSWLSAPSSHLLALAAAALIAAFGVRLLLSRPAGGWVRFV